MPPQPPGNFLDWLGNLRIPRPGFRRTSREIPSALEGGALCVHFQPLVRLADMKVFAYEALARSSSPNWRSPPELFEDAIRTDWIGPLGRMIREMAVEGCPDHPLFLNIHPSEFGESWLVQPDDPMFGHDHAIYLEITETLPLNEFERYHGVLREIRHKGARLAVDDLGAGYSNLKYIADLHPEIVKLDRGLIEGLESGTRTHRLVRHIVTMCEDLGAEVVAEGIETAGEAKAVIEAGVHYGQGYFLARPAFPPPPITNRSMRVRKDSTVPFPAPVIPSE